MGSPNQRDKDVKFQFDDVFSLTFDSDAGSLVNNTREPAGRILMQTSRFAEVIQWNVVREKETRDMRDKGLKLVARNSGSPVS